jgi:hypothetical protein
MDRAKTVKKKQSKRRTFRKPRQYLQVLSNNLNTVNTSNVNANIAAFREEQYLNKAQRNAVQKLQDVPPNSFIFRINDMEYPFKAMKFIERVSNFRNYGFKIQDQQFVEILYKGLTPDQSYYLYIERINQSEFTEEQEYFARPSLPMGVRPSGEIIYTKPDTSAWSIRWLPPVSFFYPQPVFNVQEEPHKTFYNPSGFMEYTKFLIQRPHMQEKAEKERQAVLTAEPKLRQLQVKALESALREHEQRNKTKRQFPQNIQNIMEQHILGRKFPSKYFETRNNLSRIQTNLFHQ